MQNEFEAILRIFHFCARTDARTYAYARVFISGIVQTDMDIHHAEYEWKMTFRYEDIIMTWYLQNGA